MAKSKIKVEVEGNVASLLKPAPLGKKLFSLPRHPNGKLLKRLLKDEYWADQASHLV